MACAWGAAAFWGGRTGTLAGAGLGATLLASTVGALATADAVATGAATLALAAFGRLYSANAGGPPAGRRVRVILWAALAAAVLAGGWSPGALALVTALLLLASDRAAPWAKTLGWGWGLLLVAAVVGPWVIAITVTTDGAFWSMPGQAGDLSLGARTLAGLAATFPLIALAPGAAVFAWRHRTEPGVRFAIAWFAAGLLLFEARPAANLGDILLIYPPLAWLCAASWGRETGPAARWLGAALAAAGAAALALGVIWLAGAFGDADDGGPVLLTVILLGLAGAACAFAVVRRHTAPLIVAAILSIAGTGILVGNLLPRLDLLWPSQRVVAALERLGLDPTRGLVQGPVTVAGYDEPSLVFALGAKTEFADARAAARAINEGRPAVVEARQQAAFSELLARFGLKAEAVATIRGLDYAENRAVTLTIWRKVP